MKLFFFTMLLVMSGLTVRAQYAQGDPLITSGERMYITDITDSTFFYIDSSKQLKPADAAQLRFAPLTRFPGRRRVPRELVQYPVYLRFTINNSHDSAIHGYFYPGMYFKQLALYQINTNGENEMQLIPGGKNGFVFVSVPPKSRRSFLLRAIFARSDYNFVSARIIQPDYLPNYVKQLTFYASVRKMAGFLFAGVMLMMFVFCILNYIALKRNEFLYNGIYSCCMGLIMMSYAWFYNNPAVWAGEFFSHWWLVLLNVGYIFYIQFTRKFLDTARQFPFLNKLFLSQIVILVFLIITHSIVHYFSDSVFWSYALQNAMKITAVGISFIYIILGLENKNRLMNYLSIGCAVQVICSIIALALVPISADSPNLLTSSLFYFEIGAIVSQIFFLVGLSYKQRMELVDEIPFKEAIRLNEEKAAYETKLAIIEAKQAERNRISADMHDDLGAGMTTIRLYSELAKKKLSGQNIPEIEKISFSANALLVKMNAIIWSMSSSNDTLDNMIAYIRSYALEFFENTGIECHISIPDRIPKLVVHGEIRRNVFLVVKEALNNIVKHSGATSVDIRLNKEPRGLSLTIHDNGKGIDFENLGRFGNGLQNMKKRMDDVGIEFSILNHDGVTIRLFMNTRD